MGCLIGSTLESQAQESGLVVAGADTRTAITDIYKKGEFNFNGLSANSQQVSDLSNTYQKKMGFKLQLNTENQITILNGLMDKN